MNQVGLKPPNLNVELRHRKVVLFEITLRLFEIFRVPNIKNEINYLTIGIKELQAINEIQIVYVGENNSGLAKISIKFDWNVHAILVESSPSGIPVNSEISSLEQFVGYEMAFKELSNHLFRTLDIYQVKTLYYRVSSKDKLFQQKTNSEGQWSSSKITYRNTKKVIYESNVMQEVTIELETIRNLPQPSTLRYLKNKLRNLFS